MFKGFKHFLARGNVFELAVGIIVGTAFNHIVTSLVDDIMMPPIGLILNRVNFNNLYVNLTRKHYPSLSAAKAAGAPTIHYGTFINQVIDFLIIAIVIYFLVEQFERFKGPDDPAPTMKPCPYCTRDIPVDARAAQSARPCCRSRPMATSEVGQGVAWRDSPL